MIRKSFLAISIPLLSCLAIGGAIQAACTPAQEAEWKNLPGLVASDLEKGDSQDQIETDIATNFKVPASSVAVKVLDDMITYLIDAGALTAIGLANAQTMRPAVQAMVAHNASLAIDAGAK